MSARPGADLHIHTTHSDGACSPADVVRAAHAVGLRGLAITDHDTLTGLPAARAEAGRLGIELIPGIELTAEGAGREIHLLGYFVDDADPALASAAARQREERQARASAIAERLREAGLRIDLESLRAAHPRANLGRRHFADWLARTGQAPDPRAAFERWLGDGGPAHVLRSAPGVAEGIGILRGAGGVVALAHPPLGLDDATIRDWAGLGLEALECDGPKFSRDRARQLRRRADRLGLIPVAGSDFHEHGRPGSWVGSVTTPESDLERLRAAAARPRHPAPTP